MNHYKCTMLLNASSPSKNFRHCTIRFISVMDAFVQNMCSLVYLGFEKRFSASMAL